MKKYLYKFSGPLFILLLVVSGSTYAQDSLLTFEHADRAPTESELLEWHEVFTYEVRYSLFKLGEVKVETMGDTLYNGQQAQYLRTIITSNPGIPFVGREENHYNTIFTQTDSLPHTLVYWTDNVDEEEYDETRYIYDYEAGQVYMREGEDRDTLAIEEPASSGQLIFHLGRLFAGTENDFTIPVYLNLAKGYISVNNTLKKEMRKYKAFDQPVVTYYGEGESTIDGPFGFRGDFKSWYLGDDLRVPLEAHVKVWLGNVRIKLIDYKKELAK